MSSEPLIKEPIKYKAIFIPTIDKDNTATYKQLQALFSRGKDTWIVDLDKIVVRQVEITGKKFNHRDDFSEIEELAHGIIASKGTEPLYGDFLPDGTYVITDGERRYRAYLLINTWGIDGFDKMQVFQNPRAMTDRERRILQLTSNNSKIFTALEEADAYKDLIADGLSQSEIARVVGKSKMHVSNQLKLSGLSDIERELIKDGNVSPTAMLDLVKKGMPSSERIEAIKDTADPETKKKLKVKDVAIMSDLEPDKLDPNANPLTMIKEIRIWIKALDRLIGTDSKMSDITFKMDNRIVQMLPMLKQHWTDPKKSDKKEEADPIVDGREIDPLFAEAARLVVLHQQGEPSLLQRKLKLGYSRASRIIDQLEAAEIIGSFNGSTPRIVFLPDEATLNFKLGLMHLSVLMNDDDQPF